jgi:hypothetical protein
MPIVVACNCGQRFEAVDQLAGKVVQCPACGGSLTIPDANATLPSEAIDDLGGFTQYGAATGSVPGPEAYGPAPQAYYGQPTTQRVSQEISPRSMKIVIGIGIAAVVLLVLGIAITSIWSAFMPAPAESPGDDSSGQMTAPQAPTSEPEETTVPSPTPAEPADAPAN